MISVEPFFTGASMPAPYRELVVMTRPASILDRTPGHAMIAVSTAGIGEEAWGFYPDGVRDELLEGGWGRYNRSSVVAISEGQYNALKSEIAKWAKKGYVIALRDCTDFALAVMRAAKIPVPGDSAWPDSLGKDIEALNGKGGGRCLDARPPTNQWTFSALTQSRARRTR